MIKEMNMDYNTQKLKKVDSIIDVVHYLTE